VLTRVPNNRKTIAAWEGEGKRMTAR